MSAGGEESLNPVDVCEVFINYSFRELKIQITAWARVEEGHPKSEHNFCVDKQLNKCTQ